MEIIRKKISLEQFRTRVTGAVVPYIPFNDDNRDECNDKRYGQIWKNGLSGDTNTLECMERYHTLLNILRDGVKLEKKFKKASCGGDESKYVEQFSEIDGLDTFYKYIRSSSVKIAPHSAYTKEQTGEYNGPDNGNFVYLIYDSDTYAKLGGRDWLLAWENIMFRTGSSRTGTTPYYMIPILLTQDFKDNGLLTEYTEDNYDDFTYEKVKFGGKNGIAFDVRDDRFGQLQPSDTTTAFTVNSESRLALLKLECSMSDDEVLPGVFVSDGKFYKFNRASASVDWTVAPTNDSVSCGDDETINRGDRKYRTASLVETAKRMLGESYGVYYFMIRYKNDNGDNVMKAPYTVKKAFNAYSSETENISIGDFIIKKEISGNTIKFDYVLGGKYSQDTPTSDVSYRGGGVKYSETYPYEIVSGTTTLDGYEDIPYYYEKIDYDVKKETIYSDSFNLERDAIIGDINKFRIGDIWTSGPTYEGGETINTPVFKDEFNMGVSFTPKVDIDVEFDRGNAAAFEKHFKLSECNTFEDLENYGNNYFNIS